MGCIAPRSLIKSGLSLTVPQNFSCTHLTSIRCKAQISPTTWWELQIQTGTLRVSKELRDLHFLWWEDGDTSRPPTDFRMTVHLFGATSFPGCARLSGVAFCKLLLRDNLGSSSKSGVNVSVGKEEHLDLNCLEPKYRNYRRLQYP